MTSSPWTQLPMEIRSVDEAERVVVGIVAPYDETTYLSPNPRGERVARGAFTKSIRQRGDRVPLFRAHDHARKLGVSRGFVDGAEGLIGEFSVLGGDHGDALLEDLRHGYLDSLSAGFQTLNASRDRDGVTVIREGRLHEVSVVALPAYQGAGVLSVREARPVAELFGPAPVVNLAPLPPVGYGPRR